MPSPQAQLFDDSFPTAAEPNAVFCHQEFLEKLEAHRNRPIGKRAALLMQRLAIDERRQHYKGTRGENQGWRRSRLGGNQGSHFYAWWAPRGAPPIRAGQRFEEAPPNAIFLRDIRHHDDHSPARAQSFSEYLPVSIREMRREEYGPAPWTQPQSRFASARQPVRILKGHPGSGKTTALLHAADSCGAARVLYLTYSRDLAGLARQFFDRYCSRERQFHVLTFEAFLRRLLDCDMEAAPLSVSRKRFQADLLPFERSAGPWMDRAPALYDELHAHLVGAALPVKLGRFAACSGPRTPEKNYSERRLRFLGPGAAKAALDLASRLERNNPVSLAERYFPELFLAWQAASRLSAPGRGSIPKVFFEYDAIAVDECQDLTPLEAFIVAELAAAAGQRKGVPVSIFMAGDEAQTVRPTDFEWGWMNDILHYRCGTPVEFNLSSNLRSPRTIAELVNRVWDLYAEVHKRDRPSGVGYAEVEDDATDQVLYCTAAPGSEFEQLLAELVSREGLAIVAFRDETRALLPERLRGSVLTPAEIKGLDFHTVCLLDAGPQLMSITGWSGQHYRLQGAELESIRRRLTIDELRVALSRPAERLIWADVNPTSAVVQNTLSFLNRDNVLSPVSPCTPAALLTALGEELLDVEERVQRCQSDARQYLGVKPEIAWSRAQQAVGLLGDPAKPGAVQDESVRRAARLTVCEICFCMAFRGVHLPRELGQPDLFREASQAAYAAGRIGLATVIAGIGAAAGAPPHRRVEAAGDLAQSMVKYRDELEPWLLTEIEAKAISWVRELESVLTAGENAVTLTRILPPFYDVLRLPDAARRKDQLSDTAVGFLVKHKRHAEALEILRNLPEKKPQLEAECLEATGALREAAELYRSLGKSKEALRCFRAVPDFDAAVALIRDMQDHPAAESYEWLLKMREVVRQRPANFNRAMQASEKKILEQMLEEALGIRRKQPAARKRPAARKSPAKRT